MRPFSYALLAALALLAVSIPVAAQEVRFVGGEELPVVRAAQEVLDRARYRVVRSDTVLAPDTRVEGDLVVLDADVRLGGTVEGDVVVVGGALFIRPEARVSGAIHAIGGLIVISGLTAPVDVLEIPLATRVEVRRVDDVDEVHLHAPLPEPMFVFPGAYGLNPFALRYDRVDGVSLPWEADWFPTRDEGRLRVTAGVTYRSARGALDPHIEAEWTAGRWRVDGELARSTRTADAWVRGELPNTASALLLGNDYRDYFQSDLARIGMRDTDGLPVAGTRVRLLPSIDVEASRDRSLPASSPWSLVGNLDRPNPPVQEGTIRSVRPALDLRWPGRGVTMELRVQGELGRIDPEAPTVPAWTFGHLVTDGRWSLDTFANHSLHVRHHFRRPLGTASAPRQRWSTLGGSPTLPTVPIGGLRGDRVEFVATRYDVPLERVRLPIVGAPVVRLHHRAGTAWVHGTPRPGWEQSLGLGVRLLVLTADAWIDPADTGSSTVSVGFASPF